MMMGVTCKLVVQQTVTRPKALPARVTSRHMNEDRAPPLLRALGRPEVSRMFGCRQQTLAFLCSCFNPFVTQ